MRYPIRKRMNRWLWTTLLCAVCTCPCWSLEVASAQAVASGSYEDFVQRGVFEFEQGHWEEAHAMFLRAHQLQPNARTFRGIGMSAFELRSYVESTEALAASLSDARKPLTPQQREDVAALLQRARDFVVVYDLELTPANAELSVDGQHATLRNGQLLLDAGTRVVVARAPGYQEQREQLRATPGATRSLVLELHPKTAVVNAADRLLLAQPTPPRKMRPRPSTWSLAGGAALAGAAGLGLGIATLHKHDELERCNRDLTRDTCSDHQGPRFERATNASLGVAGALGVAAIVAYFLEGRRSELAPRRARTSVLPLRHGVLLQTWF